MYVHVGKQDAPTYAYQMVRTDSREQKLEAFFGPGSTQQHNQPSDEQSEPMDDNASPNQSAGSAAHTASMEKRRQSSGVSSILRPFRKRAHRKEVKLTSVRSLQLAVRGQQHTGGWVCIRLIALT